MSNVSLEELQLAIASEQGFVDMVKQNPPEKTWEMALLLLSGYQWRILVDGGEAAYGDSALFHYLKQETALKGEIRAETAKPPQTRRHSYLSGLNRLLGEVRFHLGEIYLLMGKPTECESYWKIVPPRYAGWKALHQSDIALRAGDKTKARSWCQSIVCPEDSLLYLEKHWKLFQIYRSMHWARDASAALQVILQKEPEYRMAREEAYKFYKENQMKEAFELCSKTYVLTGDTIWANRAIELLAEHRTGDELLQSSQLLFDRLHHQQNWAQWGRLSELLYKRESYSERDAFLSYWLQALPVMLKEARAIAQLQNTGAMLADLLQQCDSNPQLKQRYYQEAAFLFMRFGVSSKNDLQAYEGAIRLLDYLQVASLELEEEEEARREIAQALGRIERESVALRGDSPFPWLRLAEGAAGQIRQAGFEDEASAFDLVLEGEQVGERRLLFLGSNSSGRSSILAALVGGPVSDKEISRTGTGMTIYTSEGSELSSDLQSKLPMVSQVVQAEWLKKNRLTLLEIAGDDCMIEREQDVLDVADYSDQVFLVLDATRPLNRHDREFVKRYLVSGGQPARLAFILHKTELLGKKQLEKVDNQVTTWLSAMLGFMPRLMMYSNKRLSDILALKEFLLSDASAVAACRFDAFDRKYARAFARCEERLGMQLNSLQDEIDYYTVLQEQLQPLAAQIDQQLLVQSEGLEVLQQELKQETLVFLNAHIPKLLRQETSRVYTGFDYKMLRNQLEEQLQRLLEEWAREHVTEFLRKELDGLSWQLEISSLQAASVYTEVKLAREALLASEYGLPLQREMSVEQEGWPEIESRLAAAIEQFIKAQTYPVTILEESSTVAGMIRGLSSFFGGADKVLEAVRQDLERQLTTNGEKVAERYRAAIFTTFEETVWKAAEAAQAYGRALLTRIQEDSRMAEELKAGSHEELRRVRVLQHQLRIRREKEQRSLSLWQLQVKHGMLIEEGRLLRLS